MFVEKLKPYEGQNCETTVIGNLLQNAGVFLSEPMIFGIGEGLSFIYWDSKQMDCPFLGGRCKQDALTDNVVKNLNLVLESKETISPPKAWKYAKEKIDCGILVGLKLDSYYLEYFTSKIHFGGHYVTLYGYDDSYAYLIDTVQQGKTVKTSLESLAEARNSRMPMSSKNKAYTITVKHNFPELKSVIVSAIRNNTCAYLNPPISNISYKGIKKAATCLPKWFDKPGMTPELVSRAGILMEKAGTGGACFRNLYCDFLKECTNMYPELHLYDAYTDFHEIAPMWTRVSELLCDAGELQSIEKLKEASVLLADISFLEEQAMNNLYNTIIEF